MSNDKMREALMAVIDLCPATCEMTPAHLMAQVAQAALSQGEPVQASQPVGEFHVSHFRNSSAMRNTEYVELVDLPEGQHKLFSSPPDYEALKAENEALRQCVTELESQLLQK